MTALPSFDDKLCAALSAAKFRGPEIIGLLHSAYHDRPHLPARYVAERLSDARTHAEQILVAILAAEQALAPRTATAPTIIIAQPELV